MRSDAVRIRCTLCFNLLRVHDISGIINKDKGLSERILSTHLNKKTPHVAGFSNLECERSVSSTILNHLLVFRPNVLSMVAKIQTHLLHP